MCSSCFSLRPLGMLSSCSPWLTQPLLSLTDLFSAVTAASGLPLIPSFYVILLSTWLPIAVSTPFLLLSSLSFPLVIINYFFTALMFYSQIPQLVDALKTLVSTALKLSTLTSFCSSLESSPNLSSTIVLHTVLHSISLLFTFTETALCLDQPGGQ